MKNLPPNSYDDWLSLSEAEQERIKDGEWDAYSRDRIDIPYMALARLISATERTVLEGQIGTFHGGEYLLHVTVPKSEFHLCPPPLEQRFEGFRVYWMHYRDDESVVDNWEFDVRGLKLDILGIPVLLNIKRSKYMSDYIVFVDATDSAGNPIVVTNTHTYYQGISFHLPNFHPDVDDLHTVLPTDANEWIHEFSVKRLLTDPENAG